MTEILDEIIEETTTNGMGNILDDLTYKVPIEIPQRVNPFCVISKEVFGEYNVRDIQTNSAWGSNPYGDAYAVVPDEMVTAIQETRGFCDITLNEDETEIVGFTAREIPEIPEPTHEPTAEERIAELEETVAVQEELLLASDEAVILLYEMQANQSEINEAQDEAITGLYEIMLT